MPAATRDDDAVKVIGCFAVVAHKPMQTGPA
jgi:hypothetical protein